MGRKKGTVAPPPAARDETPATPITSEQLDVLLKKFTAMQKNMEALQDKLDARDVSDIPDKVKKELDLDDPRLQRKITREIAADRKQMAVDSVEWIPTRTDTVTVNGVRFEIKEGVRCRVPRSVIFIVEHSDQQLKLAEELSQKLQKSLTDIGRAIEYD